MVPCTKVSRRGSFCFYEIYRADDTAGNNTPQAST